MSPHCTSLSTSGFETPLFSCANGMAILLLQYIQPMIFVRLKAVRQIPVLIVVPTLRNYNHNVFFYRHVALSLDIFSLTCNVLICIVFASMSCSARYMYCVSNCCLLSPCARLSVVVVADSDRYHKYVRVLLDKIKTIHNIKLTCITVIQVFMSLAKPGYASYLEMHRHINTLCISFVLFLSLTFGRPPDFISLDQYKINVLNKLECMCSLLSIGVNVCFKLFLPQLANIRLRINLLTGLYPKCVYCCIVGGQCCCVPGVILILLFDKLYVYLILYIVLHLLFELISLVIFMLLLFYGVR